MAAFLFLITLLFSLFVYPQNISAFTNIRNSQSLILPFRPNTTSINIEKPLPVLSRKNGKVVLNAETSACGNNHPYSGNFKICRNISNKFTCTNLTTDKSGTGALTLTPGDYQVFAPLACPLGWMCILSSVKAEGFNNSRLSPLMVDPFSWNLAPQKFVLSPEGTINIKAVGYNNLLMCPIHL